MVKSSRRAGHLIPPLLAGVAGESFVAAELSRRGYIASISLWNTRGIDILATNVASRTVTIRCKANQRGRRPWVLSAKCETLHSPSHFHVFVVLGSPNCRPSYHIVPSEAVARFVTDEPRELDVRRPCRKG